MAHNSLINNLKSFLVLTFSLVLFLNSSFAQPLVADGGISQTICNGSSVTIGGAPTANYGTPGYTYSWAPVTGLSSATIANPIASPTSTTTYTITVTDALANVATAIITVTVNPLPTVNPTFSAVVCNGVTVGGVIFNSTPSGATFNWANSNPSIGLGSSGIGNAPSYTGTNSGSTTIGGNISVTATLSGCTGPAYVYSNTIKPTPNATSTPTSQTRCSGVASNFVLSSTVAGTSYAWSTSGSGVSGNSSGSGSVIAQSVTAIGSTPGTASYFVTPTAGGCSGTMITANLTVNPIPAATASPSSAVRCSGDTVSFTVSSNVAGTTFSWTSSISNVSGVSPASGSGNSVFDTLTATTFSAGTVVYLFTPVAAGCTGTAVFPFVTVNPAPDADFSYSSSGCQFTPNALPSFLPGANAGTFTATPAGMIINPTTGEIDLSTSTPGFYTVTNTITASGGCPSVNSNHGFTITAFQDPTITNVAPVCTATIPFNIVAASSGGTWSGTGITNASLGTFDPAIAGIGAHIITYTTPNPCFYNDTTIINVGNADLLGHVTDGGFDLNSGTNTAILFNYSSTLGTFDTAQVSLIDGSGNYHFISVPPGDYLIKVFADTLIYPLAVPTYYGDAYLWDSATVFTMGCTNATADIFVIEGITVSGPGMLSGYIYEGAGFVRTPGDPIPGLDVKLGKNPGGQMIINTQSNPSGYYAFTNLPINTPGEYYTVYIDIPGLGRDSVYNITVTASNFLFPLLNYYADSNSVYPVYPLSTGLESNTSKEITFTVYPNPTSSVTTVAYTLHSASSVAIDISDVLGKTISSPVSKATQQTGDYKIDLPKLKAGIYFIRLMINNNSNTIRLMVID